MSHFKNGKIPEEYSGYIGRKIAFLCFLSAAVIFLFLLAVSAGPVKLPLAETFRALLGMDVSARTSSIVMNIRLPQALAAVIAGAGLAVSGAAMQSILRNPLGSPFTLGMSSAAAFGAALAVMVLGAGTMSSSGAITLSNRYLVASSAFACCLLAAFAIVGVSRVRGASPEVMVLTGIALGSLFSAGTMFLQYFADDVQLAAMVFWTFGDLSRATPGETAFLAALTGAGSLYFFFNRWNYNAIDSGDETAAGLGVNVTAARMAGMAAASLLTAAIVSVLGVIGFVGLVCPHMVRRIISDDHRFLLPASCLAGAALLLGSDTAARLILPPHSLPVSILTAFMGAPVFIALIIRGYRR